MAVDWTSMTDEELVLELDAGHTEQTRRRDLEAIPQTMEAMNKAYLTAEGTTEGAAWRQPTGGHDAYPLNFQVTHAGKTWESTMSGNVWEPGVSGWREVVPEGQVAAWVQPTGAHDAYQLDDQVHHAGTLWQSTVADNVWEPGSAGAESLWTDLGPYSP